MQRRSSFIELSVRSLPCLLPADHSTRRESSSVIESDSSTDVQRGGSTSPAPLVRQPLTSTSAVFSGSQVRTVEEARFFSHYIRTLSHWVDICDQKRHFATVVPQRALQVPLLAFSILAHSSRQLSLVSSVGSIDPAAYHHKALRLLIPRLNDPVEHLDENVLAAIVVLRNYEELTGRDHIASIPGVLSPASPYLDAGTHLSGVTQLLNSVSHFMGDDGLGEAAAWIGLRLDMYYSFTKSQPLRTRLENFAGSVSFVKSTAEAVANRIIHICARILSHAFVTQKPPAQEWARLHADVQEWYDAKPWQGRPMWAQEAREGSAFPYLWINNAADAIGYQHYYLSKVLLVMFHPQIWEPGFDAFARRRAAEEAVVANVRLILGISISNPSVTCLRFLASHVLQTCGALLTDAAERREAIRFLEVFEAEHGWISNATTAKLKEAWAMT